MMVFGIKKGRHRWGWALPKLHWGKYMLRYRVNFLEGCCSFPSQCPESWNKLFGLSYGHHHRNSIRIGWRGTGEEVEIAAYVYERGVCTIQRLCSVKEKEPIDMWFLLNKHTGKLVFGVGHRTYYFNWEGCKPTLGYHLWPYYGGRCKAPNDVEIVLMTGY